MKQIGKYTLTHEFPRTADFCTISWNGNSRRFYVEQLADVLSRKVLVGYKKFLLWTLPIYRKATEKEVEQFIDEELSAAAPPKDK